MGYIRHPAHHRRRHGGRGLLRRPGGGLCGLPLPRQRGIQGRADGLAAACGDDRRRFRPARRRGRPAGQRPGAAGPAGGVLPVRLPVHHPGFGGADPFGPADRTGRGGRPRDQRHGGQRDPHRRDRPRQRPVRPQPGGLAVLYPRSLQRLGRQPRHRRHRERRNPAPHPGGDGQVLWRSRGPARPARPRRHGRGVSQRDLVPVRRARPGKDVARGLFVPGGNLHRPARLRPDQSDGRGPGGAVQLDPALHHPRRPGARPPPAGWWRWPRTWA